MREYLLSEFEIYFAVSVRLDTRENMTNVIWLMQEMF